MALASDYKRNGCDVSFPIQGNQLLFIKIFIYSLFIRQTVALTSATEHAVPSKLSEK